MALRAGRISIPLPGWLPGPVGIRPKAENPTCRASWFSGSTSGELRSAGTATLAC